MLRSIINKKNQPSGIRVEVVTPIPKRIVSNKGPGFRESVIDTNNIISSISTNENKITLPSSSQNLISLLNLDNVDFIYPLTVISLDQTYVLIQFSGKLSTPFGEINSIHPINGLPVTSVYLLECDMNSTNGYIIGAIFLWCYDGIRSTYQYAQMKFLNSGDLIVLSNYTGSTTFIQNTSKNEYLTINEIKDGNYFIAKFNLGVPDPTQPNKFGLGDSLWVLPIIAFGDQNIEFCLDFDDNIYLAGTYQNKFRLGYLNAPTLTSNLITDMFIAKIGSDGNVEFVRSSDKSSDLTNGSGSDGAIRAKSITFNLTGDFPRITVIGQYNSRFKYSNEGDSFEVDNSIINYNTWIAQFDLSGNMIWLISPEPSVDNSPEDYLDGYQIVWDSLSRGNLYITGILLGDYLFHVDVGSTDDIIYVAELTVNGDFINYNYIRVDLPANQSDWYPHITFTDKLIISFFGWGDLYFNGKDPVNGTGLINLYSNSLDADNNWGNPVHICGNITNPNINLSTDGIGLYLIGTHIISLNNTNGFVRKYSLL